MTTHYTHRCAHCQARYQYQASGAGAPKDNSATHCPTCAGVVRQALSAVGPKVQRTFHLVTDGDLRDQVLAALAKQREEKAKPPKDWEAELKLKAAHFARQYFVEGGVLADYVAECARQWHDEAPPKHGFGWLARLLTEVRSGLMDPKGGVERGEVVRVPLPSEHRGQQVTGTFTVYEWSDGRQPPRVMLDMERNLETGVEIPWEDFAR